MKSIKSKLILAISILIIALLAATAIVFVNEKRQEFTHDVYTNATAFAELTAPNIVNDYNLYLAQKSFVYFNRNIQDIFQKNQDVATIKIYRYSGELVYDSTTEKTQQYTGTTRTVDGFLLKTQVQSKNPSVATVDTQRVIYLKKNPDQQNIKNIYSFVDENEITVDALKKDEKISYFVQPVGNEFAVVYGITYQALEQRIAQTTWRILLLMFFGIGVGVFMAMIYAGSITGPLMVLANGAKVLATGDFKHRFEVKTKDEIFTLANAFNKMAADLEVSTRALVYKERVTKELELASKIQTQLLPKNVPDVKGIDIAAGLIPAEEIGGDCYDFITVDENNFLLYVGDVTGHGVPSGIIVSIANALIYTLAGKKDLKSILIDTNRVIKAKTASNMFLTMVMLNWNILEQKFSYVNAGHEQIIHYHAKEQKVTMHPPGGIALGMFPDISNLLKESEITMEKDDVIVLYSDGIPESWKNETEIYGMGRFKRAVTEYSTLGSALAIRNALLADVKEFSGKYKQMDDITLIVVKKK